MNKYIAVEIGGTKQQIAVGTADGNILSSECVLLPRGFSAQDILNTIEIKINAILKTEEISAIGVGFGGPLELLTGKVLCSLQVEGWENFELKKWFIEKFNIETVVINDTVAGGIGELFCGAGKGSDRLFYTNIGTGIGGGLYFNGKYYDGSGQGAGYLGNTWVPDWTIEESGAMTRLELICSGKSVETRINKRSYIKSSKYLMNIGTRSITCKDLADGAVANDIFCTEELDKICETFSIGLANVLALTGVNKIVIGGGVAKMGNILFSRVKKHTHALSFVANQDKYEISESRLMDRAVLVGALIASANKDLIM